MARAAEVLLEQVDPCVQTAVEFGEEVHLGRGDWAYPRVVFSYLSDVFGGVCKLSRPQAVVFLRQWFFFLRESQEPSID